MTEQIFTNAISQIESQRSRDAEIAKQKAIQEQINPYNADIDASLRVALEKLQKDLNEKIQFLQSEFNANKQNMIEAADKRKIDYANSVIGAAVAIVNDNADKAINYLKDFIGKQEV